MIYKSNVHKMYSILKIGAIVIGALSGYCLIEYLYIRENRLWWIR